MSNKCPFKCQKIPTNVVGFRESCQKYAKYFRFLTFHALVIPFHRKTVKLMLVAHEVRPPCLKFQKIKSIYLNLIDNNFND